MTGPKGAGSFEAEIRLLRREVRPLVVSGPGPLLRAVDRAIATNDLGPLPRLAPAEKRALLELLDGRAARGRSLAEPRALVRFCERLAPPGPKAPEGPAATAPGR